MRAVARWGWALLILGCSTRQAPPSVTADAVGRVYEEAELDRPVSPITIPTPDYPRELQQAGAPGQVELEYIVGSDGRPEPASITVVSARSPASAPRPPKRFGTHSFIRA